MLRMSQIRCLLRRGPTEKGQIKVLINMWTFEPLTPAAGQSLSGGDGGSIIIVRRVGADGLDGGVDTDHYTVTER